MPYTKLDPETIAKARAAGKDVPDTAVIDDQGNVWPSAPAEELGPSEEVTPAGSFVRGAVKSVLPTLGGIAAGAGVGTLTGGPIGTVLGGLVGAFGTSALQERGLNKLAKDSPEGNIATLQKLSEADAAQHPYYSMAGSFIPGGFGSGLARIGNLKAPLSKTGALIGGGVGAGVDVAQQVYGGQPFDPKQLALSVAGGAATGGIVPGKSSAMSSRPKVQTAIEALQARGPSGPAPAAAPSFNPDNFINMSPKALRDASKNITSAEGQAMRELAFLKDKNIPITPEYVTELFNSNDPARVRMEIMTAEIPKIEAAQEAEAAAKLASEEKTKSNLAAQSVRALSENPPEERITTVREKPGGGIEITQPPPLASTAESAKVLASAERPQAKKSMSDFAARNKEIQRYEAQLREYGEGTPERELGDNVLAQMRKELDTDVRNFLASRAAPEAPLAVTGEEAARPRVMAKIEPPAEPPKPVLPTEPLTPAGPPPPKLEEQIAKAKEDFAALLGKDVGVDPGPTVPPGGPAPIPPKPKTVLRRTPKLPPVPEGPLVEPTVVPKGTEQADITKLKKGSEVFVQSGDATLNAKVVSINPDGTVSLKYGGNTWPTQPNKIFVIKEEKPAPVAVMEDQLKPKSTYEEKQALLESLKTQTPTEEKTLLQAEKKRGVVEDPVSVVRTSLRLKGAAYDDLRNLLKRHQNWDDYAKGKEKPDLQEFFDMLPAKAQKMVDKLWTAGAEDFPRTYKANKEVLLTSDAKKLLESQGELKKSKPVKVEAPANESPSQNEPRSFGAGEVVKAANPVEWLREGIPTPIGRIPGLRSVGAKIKENYGKLGEKFEKALEGVYIRKDQIEQPVQEQIRQVAGSLKLNDAEFGRVNQYANEVFKTGKSGIKLTPKEQEMYDFARAVIDLTGKEKASKDAPFISAVKRGEHVRRPFQQLKNFWPAVRSQEVGMIINDPARNPAKFKQLRKDFIDYMMKEHGFSEENAQKLFLTQQHNTTGEGGPHPFFKGARVEAGLGLPQSWVEPNIFRALKSYVNRHAQDLAFHQVIERDPVFAKALDLPYGTGRGEELPSKILHEGEEVNIGDLVNKDTANALKDYAGATNPNVQAFEAALGAIHGVKLGPISQIRNIIQTAGRLPGVLKAGELKEIVPSFFKALTPEAYHDALESGSVKAIRNVMPTVANDFRSAMATVAEAVTKYSGTELLSKVNDVWTDQIGRAVARNRILLGDTEFLNKFGPGDWKTKTLDEIVNYAAARFTKQFAGSYNATDQPTALLRGVGGPASVLLKLTRWPVGAFNRWYEHEFTALKKGNPIPVLAGLTGGFLATSVLNDLAQFLFNQKPRELSWEEFLNLQNQGKMTGKEAAYTVFSKVAAASTTGILGDLAFAANQVANGEYPRSYNNLLLQAAGDTMVRLEQFKEGVTEGSVGIGEGLAMLTKQLAFDQVQVARLLQHKEDKGDREERIARRMGYMPPKGQFEKGRINNPFSEAGAYRSENVDMLSNMLNNKLSKGIRPSAPDTEVRNQHMFKGNDVVGYYDFIEATQGKEAANAARERDFNNTVKKRRMFSSALSNRR